MDWLKKHIKKILIATGIIGVVLAAGVVRGLIGFIKHQYSYKNVSFNLPYFLAMMFISGVVGLLTAVIRFPNSKWRSNKKQILGVEATNFVSGTGNGFRKEFSPNWKGPIVKQATDFGNSKI